MARVTDGYTVYYNGKAVGSYSVLSDGSSRYYTSWMLEDDVREELKQYGLDRDKDLKRQMKAMSGLISEENRVPGLRQKIYVSGPFRIVRTPEWTGESFYIYRRDADKDSPDYSPLPHVAPHREGPDTPEGMREWATHYCFNKMDDGTYEAELDESWWWGGSHNDGGTIHTMIPEEWFSLPYGEFLDNVLRLSAASHYGFTREILLSKDGLREFFGYGEEKQE